MRSLLFLLLCIYSVPAFCALLDRDGMPRIVAVDHSLVLEQLQTCIMRGDWATFSGYRNYFPELDPEREMDPLITYCQDHYGAMQTVEALHTQRILVHLDQIIMIIDEREKAPTVEVDTESDDEANTSLSESEQIKSAQRKAQRECMITKSYRPIQGEFLYEEGKRLRELSWWQRWWEQAGDRERALDILFATQCPNVWPHVESVKQLIKTLPNQSSEAIQVYIAEHRAATQKMGKTLTEIKDQTWEKRWWHQGPRMGYRYFKKEPASVESDAAHHANNNNNEVGASCVIS